MASVDETLQHQAARCGSGAALGATAWGSWFHLLLAAHFRREARIAARRKRIQERMAAMRQGDSAGTTSGGPVGIRMRHREAPGARITSQ
jgi:hypothetical protein